MTKPTVLGLIPARGRSKGIPRKNIKDLNGKPLIAWTIEAALNSECLAHVAVSTEDEEIADIARKWGADVPFIRPMELAQDSSLRNKVVAHALEELPNYEYVMLLQPTSPLRQTQNINEAFELLITKNASACVSVVEQLPSPHWMFRIGENQRIIPVLEKPNFSRRQDLPKVYVLNGAIFISNVEHFQTSIEPDPFLTSETVGYEMPAKISWDIDTMEDWGKVEQFLA